MITQRYLIVKDFTFFIIKFFIEFWSFSFEALIVYCITLLVLLSYVVLDSLSEFWCWFLVGHLLVLAFVHVLWIAANDQLAWEFATCLAYLVDVLVLDVRAVECALFEGPDLVCVRAHQVCVLLVQANWCRSIHFVMSASVRQSQRATSGIDLPAEDAAVAGIHYLRIRRLIVNRSSIIRCRSHILPMSKVTHLNLTFIGLAPYVFFFRL